MRLSRTFHGETTRDGRTTTTGISTSSTESTGSGPLSASPLDDDALAALLRSGDPWRRLPHPDQLSRVADVDSAISAMLLAGAGAVTAPSRALSKRRRWRSYVLVGAGAAALALTAFAMRGGGWTGDYADGTPDGLIWTDGVPAQNAHGTDSSEFIDAFAEGGFDTVASLAPRELALPTWITWDEIVEHQLAALSAYDAQSWGVASARYYSSGFTHYAQIAWKTQWVEAVESGDTALQAEALAQWRVTLEANRDVMAAEQVEVPFELLAAAERGDVEAVRRDLEANGMGWITARVGIEGQVYGK